MARIRSIKPEFWTSERVVECSTNARLLFVGTWNFCDDKGRHPYSAKRLKMCIFPGDDDITTATVEALMGELADAGLIVPYAVDGDRYFFVSGWDHQKIDRPQPTRWPGPEEANGPFEPETFDDDSTSSRRTVDDHSILNGKEGIGEDRKGEDIPAAVAAVRSKRPTLEEVQAYCSERNAGVSAQKWFDYYTANGWKVGRNPMKDWKAAVRGWENSDYSQPSRAAPSKPAGSNLSRALAQIAEKSP